MIESLRRTIEEISATKLGLPTEPAAPVVESKPAPVEKLDPLAKTEPIEDIDFVGDGKLDDLLDTKEGLNKLLNIIVKEAITRSKAGSVEEAVQRTFQSVPGLVVNMIRRQSAMEKIVAEFYTENEDLDPYKQTVAIAANGVHAEHPDWEVSQVFDEAAKRARKSLGLREAAISGKKGTPAFGKNLSSRKTVTPKTTELQSQIDDILIEM